MTEEEDRLISLLKQEASDAFTASRAIATNAYNILSVGLVAVGAIVAYASHRHGDIYLGLPAFLALLLSFQIQAFADAQALTAYRQHLETELNRHLGSNFIVWSSRVAETRQARRNVSLVLVSALLALAIPGTIAFGYGIALTDHPSVWKTGVYSVSAVWALLITLWSFGEALQARSNAARAIRGVSANTSIPHPLSILREAFLSVVRGT